MSIPSLYSELFLRLRGVDTLYVQSLEYRLALQPGRFAKHQSSGTPQEDPDERDQSSPSHEFDTASKRHGYRKFRKVFVPFSNQVKSATLVKG